MAVIIGNGGVGERLKPAVLKTVRPERVSGVRIPPPPPLIFEFHDVKRVRCYPHWARVLSISNSFLTDESAALVKILAEPVVHNPKSICDAPVTKRQGTD